jgi:hypothetical protein
VSWPTDTEFEQFKDAMAKLNGKKIWVHCAANMRVSAFIYRYRRNNMITAYQIAIIAAGIFFLNGLLTGVWKYNQIAASEDGKAHPYVDMAHRASLLYSFAAILIATFIEISQLSNTVETIATLLLIVYFAFAIMTYMIQGLLKKTDNQLRHITASTRWFMWSLIVAEIAGFAILFYGVLVAIGVHGVAA